MWQASEAQRVKGRQRSRARDKKQRKHFFLLEEQHENFVAVVTNACGHQCKVKMSGIEKVNEKTYDVFSKNCVTEKFLEVSRRSRAKQRQRNVQKKCAARAKGAFLLIRPTVVFSPFSLPSPHSITPRDFMFCLKKL